MRNCEVFLELRTRFPDRPIDGKNEWISNSLVRERIDFFVNVSPEIAILDVPFLVIVWDLQHRLQPFFPEVGSGDEWQRRENFFSQVLKRAAYVVTATDDREERGANVLWHT